MSNIVKPFRFLHSTHEVALGAGLISRVQQIAEQHGCRKAAIVTDSFFLGGAVEDRLMELLRAGTGQGAEIWGAPNHEPDTDAVEACRAFLDRAQPDLIVVVGGGSAIDVAKVARMLLSNPGPITGIAGAVGVRMAPHASLLVAVPTTAGTGSEVSESAVISAPGSDYKLIFRSEHMTPRIALLDPELSVTAPASVTAASGYDAVTHAVEAYTSNVASPMTDPLALAAMEQLARFLPVAYREPGDLEARAACLVASMQAAIAFNSANLGLAHAISGAMGALHHTPHGLANALALPWTIAFNRPALGEKEQVLARIFGRQTAAAGLSRLRSELGLDLGLDAQIGADADLDALAAAAAKSGQIRMNPRPADAAQIRVILEAMRTPTGGGDPQLPGAPA